MDVFNQKKVLFLLCTLLFGVIFIVQIFNEPLQNSNGISRTHQYDAVNGWDFNTSKNAHKYILPHNTSLIIKPQDFCNTPVFLIIIVCSAPNNFEARNVIRDTWASMENLSQFSVKIYFLLGQALTIDYGEQIYNESKDHGDILQDWFIDSYNNLTLKSISMLKTINHNCLNKTQFLMKTDDDMYVNLLPLYAMLKAKVTTKNTLLGCLICGAKPIQDVNNKWYAPNYMFSEKVYPNYLSGTGYVMSIDVVPKLYEAALRVQIFHLEDVYITGILSKSVHIQPHNDPGFTYLKRELNPCLYRKAYTTHHITSMEMHHLYASLKTINFKDECKENSTKVNARLSNIVGIFSDKSKLKKHKNTCF